MPHAKTQSVRIEQGPLQRRLGLADVHVDTPKGPVNAVAHQLDAAVARELTMTQLDRARAARAADQQHRPVTEGRLKITKPTRRSSASFGTSRDRLLGGGGETEVFALDEERVLRLYRASHEAPDHTVAQLEHLYAGWSGSRGRHRGAPDPGGRRNGTGARTPSTDGSPGGRSHPGWPAPSRERAA